MRRKIETVDFYLEKYPDCYVPEIEDIEEWYFEGGCETPAGEWVEPDGWDQYGNPSWMLIFGLI